MYFLKLNIAFIILFAFYKLVFSNDTFSLGEGFHCWDCMLLPS